MQQRTFIGLAGVTLAVVVVTALTLGGYRTGTAVVSTSESLEPDWVDSKLTQAAAVRFDSPAGELNLQLDGDQWRVVERHGYPADNGKVWQMLEQIGDVELLEPKTDNPALHRRLGLRDRSEPDAVSMEIMIADADAQPLTHFLLGNDRPMAGRGERHYYLRRIVDNQTWVASGDLNPDRLASAWLDRALIDIKQSRMREVTIQHPGKSLVRVSRQSADEAFTLQDIPAGRTAKTTEVTAIAYGLQELRLTDVNRVDKAALNWDKVIVVNFIAFDGLQVQVQLQAKDLGIVARLTASGEGDVKAEVDRLNARLSPWVFVIPNHTVSTFSRDLDELLEPLPEEAAE